MFSDLASLIDPGAFAIVVAGTTLATIARTGWQGCLHAAQTGLGIGQETFDESANRSALARMTVAIRRGGVRGAQEPLPPDRLLARAVDVLVRSGSIRAMQESHAQASAQRAADQARAAAAFEEAGELSPVFGLVGTLFAMTQIAPAAPAEATAATFGAIASAVLSSLYGVLAAHFVYLPIANSIARRSKAEHAARDALLEWLIGEIADVVPITGSALKPAA